MDALRWFPTRAYIANETDPTLREIFDRAMVRRTRAVIDRSLEAAVADPVAYVRVSAVQGLKTVEYAAAVPTAQERLETESSPLVRGEIAEYLGAVGGVDAATTLVAMLRDDDGGVRLRAQRARGGGRRPHRRVTWPFRRERPRRPGAACVVPPTP